MVHLQPPPSQQPQPPAAPQQAHLLPLPPPDADRAGNAAEIRALDCNLASLCDHIQIEGFNSGAFSDIVVRAMESSYRLHRLVLSRSSYFRNMLHGPWKEAGLPTLVLQIDDPNVNSEAIASALAYLYGHYPKLNDSNTFRVLAAASFLDLQDLCSICTDFIISELCTSNFLQYQIFAESQDYGIHGERVKNACWGYLCQSATMELREVLPKLSSQTLEMLLTSDELWVPNEEKRFELALYILHAKGTMSEVENSEQDTRNSENASATPASPQQSGKSVIDGSSCGKLMESKLQQLCIQEKAEGITAVPNFLVDFSDCGVGFESEFSQPKPVEVRNSSSSQVQCSNHSCQIQQCASSNPLADPRAAKASSSYFELRSGVEIARNGVNDSAMEGPSGESPCYQLNNIWLCGNQSRDPPSTISGGNFSMLNDLGRCKMPSWGGRIVGRRQVKSAKGFQGMPDEDYDAFVNIFEGGSLLYCNMSFEALLDVRKQLEELGFPCKAVNDSLWLQMLLCQRVQAIGSDTCKNCCLTSNACACRQAYGYSHASSSMNYYQQGHDRNTASSTIGNLYLADAQGEGSALFGPARVHMRGAAIDGLAGIGRQTTYVQGDGLTALVGLSQGNNLHVHADQMEKVPESHDHLPASECEGPEGSSISLDLKTPLRHFPPFRFGVEFEDVHRLIDGQVKHSPEVFYAGSLWKVSVQTFNDEDPQGRRTLGLFLHRRKAEVTDSLRKVHMYVDSREKVTARYQLICPSKREVMVFGSFKQTGTLLPKAPKGWGWRTALLFDELADLLQAGALRVAAVVQLV